MQTRQLEMEKFRDEMYKSNWEAFQNKMMVIRSNEGLDGVLDALWSFHISNGFIRDNVLF